MGCANGPTNSTGGLFSWFRRAPLTEREMQHREQLQATKKLKDPANLHLKHAQWRENVGDLTNARKSYQVALQENPKSLEAKLGLARLDQLAGRSADAEVGFQNALKSRPDDPQALNALGQFYGSQKQWNKALPLLEKAADGAPGELTFRHHLAVALAQSGDMQEAFQQFKQVSGEAEAHYNIGYLLMEQGQKAMARQRFQRALALNPQLTQAQAMLDEIDGKPAETQVAEVSNPPITFPKNPIQQTAATRTIPIQANVTPQQLTPPTKWRTPVTPPPPISRTVPAQPAAVAPPVPIRKSAPAQPAAVTPVAPPAWKKRQVVKEQPQQTPAFLPPHRAEPKPAGNTLHSQGAGTPPITPAQREQWENQQRAAANQ